MGANLRYFLSQWVGQHVANDFPWATLLINVSGSFLLGLVYTIVLRLNPPVVAALRSFLGVGLLGGYTTFSSFSYETSQLLPEGTTLPGLAYALGCVAACLGAIALGTLLIRGD